MVPEDSDSKRPKRRPRDPRLNGIRDDLRAALDRRVAKETTGGDTLRIWNAVAAFTLGQRRLEDNVAHSVLREETGVKVPGVALAKLKALGIIDYQAGNEAVGISRIRVKVPQEFEQVITSRGVRLETHLPIREVPVVASGGEVTSCGRYTTAALAPSRTSVSAPAAASGTTVGGDTSNERTHDLQRWEGSKRSERAEQPPEGARSEATNAVGTASASAAQAAHAASGGEASGEVHLRAAREKTEATQEESRSLAGRAFWAEESTPRRTTTTDQDASSSDADRKHFAQVGARRLSTRTKSGCDRYEIVGQIVKITPAKDPNDRRSKDQVRIRLDGSGRSVYGPVPFALRDVEVGSRLRASVSLKRGEQVTFFKNMRKVDLRPVAADAGLAWA